jgi:hypothetical protein
MTVTERPEQPESCIRRTFSAYRFPNLPQWVIVVKYTPGMLWPPEITLPHRPASHVQHPIQRLFGAQP